MPTAMALPSPIKYHGGKSYLAKKIVALMPEHTRYVEPYFGGGSVLLAKPFGASEIVNDLDDELINFWRVLRSPTRCANLVRYLTFTPFAEEEFQRATSGSGSVDRAADFFIRNRQSRGGQGKEFATMSKRTRRGMNEHASSYISAVDGLSDMVERLRGVVIFSRQALDMVRLFDDPQTLFYLDPPYPSETRVSPGMYSHEMSQDDHKALLRCLRNVQGKVILSTYPSELYDDMLKGWEYVDIPVPKHSSAAATKPIAVEKLWMNFEREHHGHPLDI